jgi:aspartyl-tRNA(Asn)/glutamyl-tRNA(Gln) amidotransferase subunit C
MASLSQDDVRHIAQLARLKLTDDEVTRYATDMTKIFGYIDMLTSVDTNNIVPTEQVTGLTNSLRADIITPQIASPDALLATSALPIIDHQIETPSAHG